MLTALAANGLHYCSKISSGIARRPQSPASNRLSTRGSTRHSAFSLWSGAATFPTIEPVGASPLAPTQRRADAATDLEAIGNLFLQHELYEDYPIGLLHRHYDLHDGQIMV